ncbi:MAG TPA: LysE/ArgO family amino acid transporter [Noviherbaspirillum sp.]|uniref:LysE/ArgO family amino acid transporter n=1 Tax=Noviherbaspirillum sp. TaxID=1926288 RepID=UPI002D6B8D1D|nr:LysE/ArgO family amino acid transporter [Noviherbaspirillum sp.]HYD96295.1 LysE/ArgO family amino acid transporter [Noviherbaspirillum sp.]
MPLTFYLKGLGLGAGLIVAIGSQNAHVLRMGLRRQHVGLTVAVCILCEALLISAGVAGVGTTVENSPALMAMARWGGAAFLAWYGLRAWRSAFGRHALQASPQTTVLTAREAVTTVLAVTLLNPHVYLDTVVLLGAVGGQQGAEGKWWFALGAVTAGVAWFLLLGFGARLLSPWFARPSAWRVLDSIIGAVMLALAATLAAGA